MFSDPKAIALEGVTFEYSGDPVLRDVSIDINVGEMVAVIGPNASGKSTFLRQVALIHIRSSKNNFLDLQSRDNHDNHNYKLFVC